MPGNTRKPRLRYVPSQLGNSCQAPAKTRADKTRARTTGGIEKEREAPWTTRARSQGPDRVSSSKALKCLLLPRRFVQTAACPPDSHHHRRVKPPAPALPIVPAWFLESDLLCHSVFRPLPHHRRATFPGSKQAPQISKTQAHHHLFHPLPRRASFETKLPPQSQPQPF